MLHPPSDVPVRTPSSPAELQALIAEATRAGRRVRVAGAGHSEPYVVGRNDAVVLDLSLLRGIEVDAERRIARVESGCRFGFDPRDPTGLSHARNGLCAALEDEGLALPSLGGVAHQTVAGFLATGSEGGTLSRSLHPSVRAVEWVDAAGRPRRAEREDPLFEAVGCSLGLLGVVTSLEFDCVEAYGVAGHERGYERKDAPFDLFAGESDGGVVSFLRDWDFARALWWPQPGVDRLTTWVGNAVPRPTKRQRYTAFPTVAGSDMPVQHAAGAALRLVDRAIRVSRPQPLRRLAHAGLRPMYRAFVPVGDSREFSGPWHEVIPLDDGMDERALPVRFTEVWLDVSQAPEALRRLHRHFQAGFSATGSFAVELYGAPESPFLLAPGFGRESLRINVFWFGHSATPAHELFAPIWRLLADLELRYHWGKVMPGVQDDRRTESFEDVRATEDPDGRFLAPVWAQRSQGTPPSDRRGVRPVRRERPRFGMQPVDLDFIEQARCSFTVTIDTRASPERVSQLLSTDPSRWVADLREWYRLSPEGSKEIVVDERFWFMTLRVRTIVNEPGRRWSASIDACSLPLAERMLEDAIIERIGDRTRATWTIYYDPPSPLRATEPAIRPLFRGLFVKWCRAAERLLEGEET